MAVVVALAICLIMPAVKTEAASYKAVNTKKLETSIRFAAATNGVQYKKALYYIFANELYAYSDSLAKKGRAPVVKAETAYEFAIYSNTLIYRGANNELHNMNLKKKTDKVICKDASRLISFENKKIKYVDVNGTTKLVSTKGKVLSVKEKAPVFDTGGLGVLSSSSFSINDSYYTGLLFKDGTFSLLKYDGEEYKVLLEKSDINTLNCLMIAGKPYFLTAPTVCIEKWEDGVDENGETIYEWDWYMDYCDFEGESTLYLLENDELTAMATRELTECNYAEDVEITTMGGWLVINSMDEYNDNLYVYDTELNVLYNISFDIENYTYRFDIRDNKIYYYKGNWNFSTYEDDGVSEKKHVSKLSIIDIEKLVK